MVRETINPAQKLATFSEHWSPRVVAAMNDYQFKVVKFQGEFVRHDHKDTDEVFLVLSGEMKIGLWDRTVALRAGEMFVVPKGSDTAVAAVRGVLHARFPNTRRAEGVLLHGALQQGNPPLCLVH